MLTSDEKKPLCDEDLQEVVGGAAAPRLGKINWETVAKKWVEYADTLTVIPERYRELDVAARCIFLIQVESIVYTLLQTEPVDGPVRRIYNDKECHC